METAYAQLVAEGYIRSQEKVGYFVEAVEQGQAPATGGLWSCRRFQGLSGRRILRPTTCRRRPFPFPSGPSFSGRCFWTTERSFWGRCRQGGAYVLRQAIADYLYGFRSMTVSGSDSGGAGTDFLYNLLIQLLGRDKCYGVEDPGYGKDPAGLRGCQGCPACRCRWMGMESDRPAGGGQVLHLSPSHHFPTGIVTPIGRRQAPAGVGGGRGRDDTSLRRLRQRVPAGWPPHSYAPIH